MKFNKENFDQIKKEIAHYGAKLLAVSKTKPVDTIKELYDYGQKAYGENYVQELVQKQSSLPSDIEWHFIGHLQSNKVKLIANFVNQIHGVDSLKLLQEINKQAQRNNRIQKCFLQIYIASEETKFGLSFDEAVETLNDPALTELKNVEINGFMGMASFTDNTEKVHAEFRSLRDFFDEQKKIKQNAIVNLQELSMGMTDDYKIALEEGSTLIRIGSAIFGERTAI